MIITKSEPFTIKEIEKLKEQKIALESLALDLKRVSLGYHRGSVKMAERFYEEAVRRRDETDLSSLKPYIRKVLSKIQTLQKDRSRTAEDAQMISTLVQNYTTHNF